MAAPNIPMPANCFTSPPGAAFPLAEALALAAAVAELLAELKSLPAALVALAYTELKLGFVASTLDNSVLPTDKAELSSWDAELRMEDKVAELVAATDARDFAEEIMEERSKEDVADCARVKEKRGRSGARRVEGRIVSSG